MEEKKCPLILVSTPTHDGKVVSEYLLGAIQSTQNAFDEHFKLGFMISEGSSMITKARDMAAMKFYFDTHADYLLFIDADQGFSPLDITSLLQVIEAGYDVAAAPVAKKSLNTHYAVLHAMTAMHENGEFSDFSGAMEFNLVLKNPKETGKIRQVSHIGTGMMLISRKALDRLMEVGKNSELQYLFHSDKLGDEVFVPSLFSPIFFDGGYRGEDFSFCDRIAEAGLKIGVDTSIRVDHVGRYTYNGSYTNFERMKAFLNEV